MRNQLLAIVGHQPTSADALPPFEDQFPRIAAAIGAAPPPDARNALRLRAAFERLRESTRVDAVQ